MKHRLMIATAACLTFAATAASADCAAEIAALGVAKDGSTAQLAPAATLQPGGDAAATAPATAPGSTEGKVAKDGSTAPLGTDPALATSAEDAQAQSQGGATAAEQAQGAEGGGDGAGTMRAEALARAQTALDAGDEAACLQAVEEAKGL
jgi:hypothetical protein